MGKIWINHSEFHRFSLQMDPSTPGYPHSKQSPAKAANPANYCNQKINVKKLKRTQLGIYHLESRWLATPMYCWFIMAPKTNRHRTWELGDLLSIHQAEHSWPILPTNIKSCAFTSMRFKTCANDLSHQSADEPSIGFWIAILMDSKL